MPQILVSATFERWLRGLRDRRAEMRIRARIDRIASGNEGDARPVGTGISESRIHYGPGYRLYYLRRGALLIVMLCGGDKSSQRRDIEHARQLAEEWRKQNDGDFSIL